jgi:hypothetical protein
VTAFFSKIPSAFFKNPERQRVFFLKSRAPARDPYRNQAHWAENGRSDSLFLKSRASARDPYGNQDLQVALSGLPERLR